MITKEIKADAQLLVEAIEFGYPVSSIGTAAQGLVRSLGGTTDVSKLTPGSTALYILALLISSMQA